MVLTHDHQRWVTTERNGAESTVTATGVIDRKMVFDRISTLVVCRTSNLRVMSRDCNLIPIRSLKLAHVQCDFFLIR